MLVMLPPMWRGSVSSIVVRRMVRSVAVEDSAGVRQSQPGRPVVVGIGSSHVPLPQRLAGPQSFAGAGGQVLEDDSDNLFRVHKIYKSAN